MLARRFFAQGCGAALLGLAASSVGASSPGASSTRAAAAGGDSPIAATSDTALQPFSAHYTAEWKTITVGVSDLELKPDTTSGAYIYTWTMAARGVFRLVYSNDVIQKSWVSIVADHVRPDRYQAEDGDATAHIDFDWNAKRARGVSDKKPVDLKLTDGTQDIMSIQVEVMLDLKNGKLPNTFRILDKDETKDFIYTQEGTAKLRTSLGQLDTIIVASRRVGNDRVLRMWFAPSLGFVPVQAERYRGDKLEFAMKIKTLKQ
jgi:hypothetical protein